MGERTHAKAPFGFWYSVPCYVELYWVTYQSVFLFVFKEFVVAYIFVNGDHHHSQLRGGLLLRWRGQLSLIIAFLKLNAEETKTSDPVLPRLTHQQRPMNK